MKTDYKEVKVNKEWIKKNIINVVWQKDIYPARVNTFINYIKNGKFREHSLLTVKEDKVTGKYKIIDGQHKLRAVELTDSEILFDLRILKDTSDKEDMDEYDAITDVKHQRSIDIIKRYYKGEKLDWLVAFFDEKKFPINITLHGGRNSLRIDNFLAIIYNGTKRNLVRTSLSREKLRSFIKSLDAEMYATAKEFCEIYKKCYGDPSSDNWMYKNIVMFTMMRIYLTNKGFFKEKEIIELFKQVEKNAGVRQESFVSTTGALETLTKKIYKVLNKGRSQNKFVQYWDEELLLPLEE